MRKYGTRNIVNRYAGDKPVLRRYVGDVLVWEPTPIDTDLLIHLKFDGNVNDSSSYMQSVSLLNPLDASYVNGDRRQAIHMGDNTTQANKANIEIATNLDLQSINDEWTIAYYIKCDRIASNIFCTHNGTDTQGIDITILSDGRSDLYLNRGIAEELDTLRSSGTSNNGQVDVNTFHHFAWVRSGTSVKCYYNFVQTNEKTIASLDLSSTNNWLINRRGNSRANATYDDFRVYKRALSDEEITALQY